MKKFQEKPFARPAKPAAKDQTQAIPDVPLSKKELKQATEAWKAKRKPNYATVQARTVGLVPRAPRAALMLRLAAESDLRSIRCRPAPPRVRCAEFLLLLTISHLC